MTDEKYYELMGLSNISVSSLANDPNYVKCPRCWNYSAEGRFNHDGLCDRCCSNIVQGWPNHESVPHILESRRQQLAKFSEKQA